MADTVLSRRGYSSVSQKDSAYAQEDPRWLPAKANTQQPALYDPADDGGPSKKGLQQEQPIETSKADLLIMGGLLAAAATLRFVHIGHPAGVVFDEVHFGRFSSYYLKREYFFDVHPPLAKLILAFAGWVMGFDGDFGFDNIGDDYLKAGVPYRGMRAFPAVFGSLTVPVIYAIMREIGTPRVFSIFSAALILMDNAHITQTRLILLDAPLLLFMSIAIFSYIRFHRLRYNEFSFRWWRWLATTGVFLALTISCKMNGLMTFMTIGAAVAIDMWNILDYKRGHDLELVIKHFVARLWTLIVLPAFVYMFWFWVHFAILTKSGTGDDFMSPAFQMTLHNSPLTLNAEEIRYFDVLQLQHKGTKAFLHSHPDRYPLKYPDGRISSAGQQVTGYLFNDTNNHWAVLPTKEVPETGRGNIVRHNDVIQLRHIATNTLLLSHDVASSLMATNTEFTTWNDTQPSAEELQTKDGEEPPTWQDRTPETLFRLEIDDAHEGQQWKTKSGYFKLVHVETAVAMWTYSDQHLPEWAFKQQEVNGNKKVEEKRNLWVPSDIIKPNVTDMLRPPAPVKKVQSRNFFKKFFELQILMLQHNAALTDSHPYASQPVEWPFLGSGISFWTSASELKQQVYLIGNFVGWWLASASLAVFLGFCIGDALTWRRNNDLIGSRLRSRHLKTTGFFVMGWAFHYLPFYLMTRQLFLHHYMPAHIFSVLAAGCILHFLCTDTINYPNSIYGPQARRRPLQHPRQHAQVSMAHIGVTAVLLLFVLAGFIYLSPLTYGTPGLEPEAVSRRRILSSWTLHFAK